MSKNIGIIFCAERPIENEAMLLARSIRELGGTLADSAIYAYQPRRGYELSARAQCELKLLGVEYIEHVRNEALSHYPPANKSIVCEYSESNLDHEYLVLMDTDKLLVGELSILEAKAGIDVALRPAHRKSIGYSSSSEANYRYWRNIWHEFGIGDPRIRATTTIDGKNIYGYWNSGLVIVRRDAGVFAAWNEAITRIAAKKLEPAASVFFLDQIALAAALHKGPWRIETLPLGYNYPIHRHFMAGIPEDRCAKGVKDLVTVHYHGMMRDPYFCDIFSVFSDGGALGDWLKEALAYYRIPPHHPWSKRLYSRFKKRIRERLKK